jgi:hypothetical protein
MTSPFPASRTTLARRLVSATIALALCALAAACSGTPASPTDTRSSERRVLTGGAGGTFCPPEACEGFTGRIEIVAGGGTLHGPTLGAQLGDEITRFELTSRLTGTGRFGEGFIDAVFDRESATVRTIWYSGDSGQILQATNQSGTPEYTTVDEKSCESGVLLVTTLTVTLENLGRTTIVERHCTGGGTVGR